MKRECIRLAKRALPSEPIENLVEDLVDTRPEPELRFDIVRAIASLPEHYRAIIVLRDIEEMTIAEIATAIEATKEATKARLHRARAMMREYLEA